MARTKSTPKNQVRAESAATSKVVSKKKPAPKTSVVNPATSTLGPQEAASARKEILEMIEQSKKPVTPVKASRRPTLKKPAPTPTLRLKTEAPDATVAKPQAVVTPKLVFKPLVKPNMKPAPKPAPQEEAPKMLPTQPIPAKLAQPTMAASSSKPAQPANVEKKARSASPRRVVGIFALAIAVVIVVALGVVALGLYTFKWNDALTTGVAETLPYPAAVVRTSWISYSQYTHDFKALKQYYEKQQSYTSSEVTMPTDDVIRGIIMDKLINDRVLKYESGQLGITVTDEEVDKEIKAVIEDAGGEQELASSLEDLYGWTIDDFKESILRPFLLREKVQEKLSSDETLPANSDAKQRIGEVETLIKDGGQTFEDLAQQFSEDSTAEQGGDLGYMSRGDLVAEFADAAFALEPGEVSGVVKTKYGYHIIKVEEKVTNDGSQSPSLPEGEELIHARHILIRTTNVDDWLKGKVDETRIYRLLK